MTRLRRFGEWCFNPDTDEVTGGGKSVTLEPRVAGLLEYFLDHPGELLSHDRLVEAVWDGRVVSDEAVRRCVSSLRQALAIDGEETFIRTVHKKGYVAEFPPPGQVVAVAGNHVSRPLALALLAVILGVILFWLNRAPAPPSTETEDETTAEVIVSAPPDNSVAVLPFVNFGSEEHQYFVDGIHDDVITQLAKITSLRVISRSSVMEYRDTDKNMKTIGRELGVATVIDGSVRREGDRIRLNAQLLDADTDEHLWAESFDRELTTENIFAIQTEIAMAIADALDAALSADELSRIAAIPTRNMAALEGYFRGRQLMAGRTSQGLADAIGYFEAAIALDPDFALAYVGLSDCYLLQIPYIGLPQAEMVAKAEVAIDKALALNDKLGEAHASLGLLKTWSNDVDDAEAAFKRAISLNPNYAMAYNWYGSLKDEQEKPGESLALTRKAAELDPRSAVLSFNLARTLTDFGRFDEAISQLERAIEIAPASPIGYLGKAEFLWFVSGKLDEAMRWTLKAHGLDSKSASTNTFMAYLLLDLGAEREAECLLRPAIAQAPEHFGLNLVMLELHLRRGNEDEALEYAQRAFALWPDYVFPVSLAVLRDRDLRTGRYDKARARYESNFPELLGDNDPEVGARNFRAAIDLVLVLRPNGEHGLADTLLGESLDHIRKAQRFGAIGYGFEDARIYMLQDRPEQALSALRQAVDAGWRANWWHQFVHDPVMDSIRHEPEFQAMGEEIRRDMADQLGRVKQMDDFGDPCSAMPAMAQPVEG